MPSNSSNGSRASRSSGGSGGGNPGERQRASSSTRNGTSSSSRRGGGSRSGSSSGRRSTKSNPDAMSPVTQGYRSGRRRGMSAVESIKSAGSRAVETVGEHPMPVALIGAGLAWLLLESRGIRPTDARLIERSREAVGELGETIAGAVSTAAESVAEGASHVGEYVASAASAVGETTSSGYEYSRETLGSLWDRHPLAMSAAILSAGIAAGMLLPGTMKESSLFGDAAGSVTEKVRRKGGELIEEGRRMAATTLNAARREGERQGLTADEIGHKVKRIARSGRKAVTGG